MCCGIKVINVVDSELFFAAFEHCGCFVRVSTLESEYNRLGKFELLTSCNDSFSELISEEDTSKNVNKDSFDLGVVMNKHHGLLEGFSLCGTTDVQEIGRLSSVEFDDIHCRHGESSTIDEASNVSTDMDVVQIVLGSNGFSWVVSAGIFLIEDVLLTELGVAVNSDLRISSNKSVVVGHNKGVDFYHVAITFIEAVQNRVEHLGYLVNFPRNSETFSSQLHIFLSKSLAGKNGNLVNQFGCLFSDIFDRHTSSNRVNESRASSSSV